MTIPYYVNNPAAPCTAAAFCTGKIVGATAATFNTTNDTNDLVDGFVGSKNFTSNTGADFGSKLYHFSEISDPVGDGYSGWDGVGNWKVWWEVSFGFGATDFTLREIHICKLDSFCNSLATLASKTGIAQVIAYNGSYNYTLPGSAFSLAAGDKIVVAWAAGNTATPAKSLSVKYQANVGPFGGPYTPPAFAYIDAPLASSSFVPRLMLMGIG